MFRGTVRTIHFVGIGGIGMSGIAEVLLSQGFAVTGSDLSAGTAVQRLRGLGAQVAVGHDPANLCDADVLVRSTAVGDDNPEVVEARRRGVPVIRRAEMLAELMRLKYGIAIAGSHGKTTTTSLVAQVLSVAGVDPTVVIGGRLKALGGSNARHGGGEYLVAEADESDGSFNLLAPTVALVTNIDPEHLDHHGSVEALEAAFAEFVGRVPFYGFAALCLDHPAVQRLLPGVRRRVVTYGLTRHAEYRAVDVVPDGLETSFTAMRADTVLGPVRLPMPGRHNVQNAVGALAVALELQVPFAVAARALEAFTGVERRFTVRGVEAGVAVVDDYAHHPEEIQATLSAAQAAYPDGRVIAVFQPHRHSRLASLADDFAGAFHGADRVVVCPVYAAGEPPVDGHAPEDVAAWIRGRGHRDVVAADDLGQAAGDAVSGVRPGDVIVTVGAGDVWRVCDDALARLAGS